MQIEFGKWAYIMKLKQAAAVLAAGTLCITTAASVFAEAPQAAAQTSDYDVLSLPVQILDFNRDNLFFEYTLYNGLDFVDTANPTYDSDAVDADGKPLGVAYAPGLVETPLVNTLTYKPEQVERIAKLVGQALTEKDAYQDAEPYQTLRGKILLPGTTMLSYTPDAVLGKDASQNTVLANWLPVSNAENAFLWENGICYQTAADRAGRSPTVWYFDGDHLHFVDKSVTLTRTFSVVPGKTYNISWYNNQKSENIKVHISCGSIEQDIDTPDASIMIPDDVRELTFTLSSAADTDSELVALYFNENAEGVGQFNTFGVGAAEGEIAERAKWIPSEGVNISTANGGLTGYIGTELCSRDGDGVKFVADAALRRNFAVNPDSQLKLYYWNEGTPTLNVYKTDGTLLGSCTATANGFNTAYISIPDGVNEVSVEIVGKPNDRVAALDITSSEGVRMGSLASVQTFNTQAEMLNATNLSAVDYTNYMLSHLFIPTEGLNVEDTRYDNLILRRQDDGSYLFDSELPVVYDTASKMLYNDAQRGEDRKGFFPVDGLPGGETTTSAENGDHNYHFTLHSGGKFVYKADKDLYFDFSGDDDVYLFINNNLALDLGGAHLKASKRVNLNEMAAQLGLADGQTYNFDFFYMERHTDASNLRISTNIDVQRRIDNASAKVVQNVQFVLDDLDTPPEELYVQAYLNGQPYDSPMKFTPDELARRLELEGGHDYTFKLLTNTDEYELTITGETLVKADVNNVEKTLVYTLRKKGTTPVDPVTPSPAPEEPTPAPVVTPAPDNGSDNNSNNNNNSGDTAASTTPAPTAQPTAAPATQAATQTVTAAAAANTIPQTADASHPVLLGILCVVGAFGFGVVYAKRMKKF